MKRILFIAMISGLAIAAAAAGAGFEKVDGPCGLTFPGDHGPHPDYRTEWWYWTGNLSAADGRRLGFQLTFFRSRITVPGSKRSRPETPSAWRSDHIYMAHAAVSDISGKRYYFREEIAREALNMAGAVSTDGGVRLRLKGWSAEIDPAHHRLRADADDFSLDLKLIPLKPLVLHGESGYSPKGDAPERASCYYSFTRLHAEGTVRVGKDRSRVTGSSWMDQEFSTAVLEPGVSGWDWFCLQLSDNTELMIFLVRKTDGGATGASSGTHVPSSGAPIPLARDRFSIRPVKTWKSPHSGAVYPSGWRLSIPSLRLNISITPSLDDQEAHSRRGIGAVYWEGAVTVEGEKQGKTITGVGYVELTGYDRPFDAPL